MNLAAYQQRQRIRREAEAFVVWREGSSVDWDCTISELSEATGLSYDAVRRIVRTRRWPVQNGEMARHQNRSSLTKVFPKTPEPRHAYA